MDEDTEATIHVKKGLGRKKEREEKETAEIKGRKKEGGDRFRRILSWETAFEGQRGKERVGPSFPFLLLRPPCLGLHLQNRRV